VFVDPTHPADHAAAPAAEVEPATAARPASARLRSTRALWRTGAALLALAAFGASAQLATNEVVVKPGDTLTKIAGTYRTSVKELVAYNDIENPNVIIVGQTIAIPPGTGELRHDVRAGENLTSIAATYGTTVDAIIRRNNLADANKIRIGQTLVVPRTASAPTATEPTAPSPAAPTTTAPPAQAGGTATSASLGTPTAPVTAPSTTTPPTTAAPTTSATPTTAPTTTAPTTIPRVTVPSGGAVSTMWVVQPGDTIASIAARFGLAPRRLASVNALSENDELVPGQRIYVPQS
jgi:LysM repeat protein